MSSERVASAFLTLGITETTGTETISGPENEPAMHVRGRAEKSASK